MTMQRDPREASSRGAEGGIALTPSPRGRSTAPHLSIWLPLAVKAAAAAGIALILAVIGAKAGAHRSPPSPDPGPSAVPPVVAANLIGLPAGTAIDDAGSRAESPSNVSMLVARDPGGSPREPGGHGDDPVPAA